MHTILSSQFTALERSLLSIGVLVTSVATAWLSASWHHPAWGQIVPDATLPNPSVVPDNCTDCAITGGTTAGTNLFHSFEQFSIPANGSARFSNAAAIDRIISRVTGRSPSRINGLLEAVGTADVYLINPNGIVFGANAQLNVGGSFIATSADRILFADGVEFSASEPNAPLLTVAVPIGLQFGASPGAIEVQSPILQGTGGTTLGLVGGDVSLSGGELTVPGGRIELGSVGENETLTLQVDGRPLTLGYNTVSAFRDIEFSNGMLVGVGGTQAGSMHVQGRRIRITEGSQLVSLASRTSGAGEVTLIASEELSLIRTSSDQTGIFNEVSGNASGQSTGLLAIETPSLVITGGAQISTSTFGTGQGVDLTINADTIDLQGALGTEPSGIFSFSEAGADGQGGNVTIDTNRLTLRNGAQISVSTFGNGDSGTLTVRATEQVDVMGRSPQNRNIASGLFSSIERDSTGNSGTLSIETARLNILDGAQVATVARNTGQGGNLIVNASESVLLSGFAPPLQDGVDANRSGLFVSAEPGSSGNGGTLRLTAPDLVIENNARISADTFGTGNGGDAFFTVDRLVLQNGGQLRAASFEEGGVDAGTAGSIDITAQTVAVAGGSEINVSSALSQSGNLTIRAREIRLQNGELTAETRETAPGTSGANIDLQGLELLFLGDRSLISARAFDDADGGNVTIDASNGFITAPFDQDSDIIANAVEGRGGNITITTRGIFGLEERRAIPGNGTNDIDASSQFGVAGTVTINRIDVDPSRGLAELPSSVVDASRLIAQGCRDGAIAQQRSEFIVTGRGGLPPGPDGVLEREWLLTAWALPEEPPSASTTSPTLPPSSVSSPVSSNRGSHRALQPVVEAQDWTRQPNGTIVLTAQHSNHRGDFITGLNTCVE